MNRIELYYDLKNGTLYLSAVQKQEFNFLAPEEMQSLPGPIIEAYEAMQSSIAGNMTELRSDIRAIIASICKEYNIRTSNLKLRIQGLQKVGLVSTFAAFILDKFWEGSGSKRIKPDDISQEQVKHGLDVINHMLRVMIYLQPGVR